MSQAKLIGFFVGGIAVGAIVSVGIMLAKNAKKAVDISSAVSRPLLVVDGNTYDASNLPGDSKMEYFTLEGNIYNAQKNILSQIAVRMAMSKDVGKPISKDNLPSMKELMPVAGVTEMEAKQYYDRVVSQMGAAFFNGQPFDKIKTQLLEQMNQQKMYEILGTKIKEFETGGRVKFLIQEPQAPQVNIDVAGYPSLGAENSSNVFVEVFDYLCSHCRETEPILEKVEKELSSKAKFVRIPFALNPEGLSGALAKGGFCSFKQGVKQFADYSKVAFKIPFSKMQPESGKDPKESFVAITLDAAKEASLNMDNFKTCLVSQEATDYINKVRGQFNEANGFKGTPSFYLNGKILSISHEQLEETLKTALK